MSKRYKFKKGGFGMSKTIKIIDLINALANNDKKPYQVKYEGNIYTWDCLNHYVNRKNGTSLFYAVIDYKDFLNDTVEIIEQQEEIDIQNIEEIKFPDNTCLRDTRDLIVNSLVKAVKQLDNKLKEK